MARNRTVFLIVLLLASYGQFTAILYLPALPAIAHGLGTSTHWIKFTVSIYFFGFAGSQLFYGPISDVLGRKKPLILGTCLLVLGSIVCAISTSVSVLILGRLLQGLGAGSGLVLSRSILRDEFKDSQLSHVFSNVLVFNMIIISIAPLIGGYVVHYIDWRFNFIFLIIVFLLSLLVISKFLPETVKETTSWRYTLGHTKKGLIELFHSQSYLCYATLIFLNFAGTASWLTVGPILLQKSIGITPVMYGWIGMVLGFCFAVGAFINGKMVKRLGIHQLIWIGLTMMLFSGLSLLVFMMLHWLNVWVVVLPVGFFIFSTSFVFANVFTGALNPFGYMAGLASSVFGFVEILGGGLSSAILSSIHDKTQLPLTIAIIVISTLSLFIYGIFRQRNERDVRKTLPPDVL